MEKNGNQLLDKQKKLKTVYNETKGITLVALVVTIIVLLILAGVSLSAVLNQDGIFSRAEDATKKYSEAKAKETLELAFGALQMEKYEQGLTLDSLDTRITEEINKMGGEEVGDDKSEVIIDGYKFPVDRTVPKIKDGTEKAEFGEKDTVKKKASDGTWWIPKGFAEASDSSETIQGGKVIEDKAGNQWVWIPCYLDDNGVKKGQQQYSQATEYKRTDFGKLVGGSYSEYSETLDETDEASIKKYGGFYIGRYEAGADIDVTSEDNTRKVYIQKNKIPYNFISIADCTTKSTNFASENNYDTNKVYTKLVSSYGWDTALSFIAVTNSSYATNSTQGNYSDTNFVSGSQLMNTGLTTAVCNIYDMGGNLLEITSESYSYDGQTYVVRGGYYSDYASGYSADSRDISSGVAFDNYGFRPLLYIK